MAYFQSLAAPMDTQTPLLSSAFKKAGGMVPYVDDYFSPPTKPTVARMTAVPGAPTLVFVLADDLGFNDVSETPKEPSNPKENTKQMSEFFLTFQRHHVMNFTFKFHVSLAFRDLSETP